MDEIYEISEYYPIRISDGELRSYLNHHITHLQSCYDKALFSSAYPHLHILYMIFVYFQLIRIAREKKKEFELCWIGFPSQEKSFLENPTHPLSFSRVNEKSVFRFFRLVGFDDGTIGDISALVSKRNECMHAAGKIHCHDMSEFEKELNEYGRRMRVIIDKQKLFLQGLYENNLSQFDQDYQITQDDIELNYGEFSLFELRILARGKTDQVSSHLNSEYL